MRAPRIAILSAAGIALTLGVAAASIGRDAVGARGPIARAAGARPLVGPRRIASYLHLSGDQRKQARGVGGRRLTHRGASPSTG